MKGENSKQSDEPVGIVINGATRPIESTVFLAYVWGPPEEPTRNEPKAA
jgi:hypothetical protein